MIERHEDEKPSVKYNGKLYVEKKEEKKGKFMAVINV